jgi:hypothetical protein
LASCHGPNRIDEAGSGYVVIRSDLHDLVSFRIYPDAPGFIGFACDCWISSDSMTSISHR